MSQSINESVIEDLTVLGFDHSEAVKIVVESDFDFITSSQLDPVGQFELILYKQKTPVQKCTGVFLYVFFKLL
jgi:hypothetical protein